VIRCRVGVFGSGRVRIHDLHCNPIDAEVQVPPKQSTAPPPAKPVGVPNRVAAPDQTDLAIVRTNLANERTLLAYLRTAFVMAVSGGTIIKFFGDETRWLVAAYGLIALGAVLLVAGIVRFFRWKRRLR